MKKLMIGLLALTFALSLSAIAQQDATAPAQADAKAAPAPLMTLKGTVKTDGDKVMFVNDADNKSWDVVNPKELKGHDGHHVELSAHVYADKNQIHVMTVKMLSGDDTMNK